MKWIEDHRRECKINDSDKCIGCLHISEAVWAWTEAKEEIEAKKREPKPEPKPREKVYNYILKEWI